MQSESGEQANVGVLPAHGDLHGRESSQIPHIDDEGARKAEEFRMLLVGFGTGLTVALIFLVYIVFEAARWLP